MQRAGLTTNIVVAATDEGTMIVVEDRPGEIRVSPRLKPLLKATIEFMPHSGRLMDSESFNDDA